MTCRKRHPSHSAFVAACAFTAVWLASPTTTAAERTASATAVAGRAAQGSTEVPDFSGVWVRAWREAQLFDPPDSGPGPVTGDPAWPHIRGGASPWIADLRSPILRPEARAHLSALADQQKAGHAIFDNDTLCLPLGVLATLNLFDAIQILQTPSQVIFIYARDHQVRYVHLNRPHAKVVTPSWYGESVGHYEGKTLVVDTIGMNDKTLVDRYGTTHSTSLHTVERYRFSDDGVFQVTVTVEDPATFTTPWTAKGSYRHDPKTVFEEIVCAENNRGTSDGGIQPPTALKADF